MKTKLLLLFLFTLSLTHWGLAQTKPAGDSSRIELDGSTIKAIEKHKEYNKKNPLIPGYRIQTYAGSSRQQAMTIRNEIAEKYPEYVAYVVYKQPTFRVRVGDFRSRFEAQKLLNEIKPVYSSSFIVPDDINPNPVLAPKPEEGEPTEPKNP